MKNETTKNGELPLTQNGSLKVELIPMPSGDNPWRTRGEYEEEKRRDTLRFRLTIAALIVSIIGVLATSITAISAIKELVK